MTTRPAIVLALVFVFMLVMGVVAVIAQANADGGFDLAVEKIEPTAPDLNAGEEARFKVTYRNNGPDAVPTTPTIYISLTVMTTDDPPKVIGLPCLPEEAPGASGLGPGDSNAHVFQDCNPILPLEDDYVAKAELLMIEGQADVPAGERVYVSLMDGNAANDVGLSDTFRAGPPESALPDELGRLFAGLGMFAAVMAIMAVGTEVVIDSLKVSLGMKSKVMSLDALERMEKLMPGQLAALGVGAADQEVFEAVTQNLRSTLETSLKFIQDSEVRQKMKEGEFSKVFAKLKEMAATSDLDQVAKLRAEAKGKATDAIERIANALNLKPALQAEITTRVTELIDDFDDQNVDQLLGDIAQKFVDLNWSEILAEDWLPSQLDRGQESILNIFEAQVKPQLEGLGLDPDLLEAARGQLELSLSALKTQVEQATDTYVESLRNLLDAVEARRFGTQSPLRKVWRRLRAAERGDEASAFVLGLIVCGSAWLAGVMLHWPLLVELRPWADRLLSSIALGLLVGLATWVLLFVAARIGRYLFLQKTDQHPDTVDWATLRYVEYLWNYIRSRDPDKDIDPDKFHQAPSAEELAEVKLTATTAAQVVLARSDQQRDEEASRLRWLRFISALVGFYLAYLMQIDAAELLDAAVPGIADTINGVLYLTGEQLHAFHSIFSNERAITAGIILTGLAASAGSTFWHDQLDRLQQAKKGAESAAQLLEQARQISSGQGQGK